MYQKKTKNQNHKLSITIKKSKGKLDINAMLNLSQFSPLKTYQLNIFKNYS